MNCDRVKEELLLSFAPGMTESLRPELLSHIRDCADCGAFYKEQRELASLLPSDSLFYPTRGEAAVLVQDIEERIDRIESERPWWQDVRLWWLRVFAPRRAVALAATLILMLTAGLVADRAWRDAGAESTAAMVKSDSPLDIFADLQLEEPDDETVATLLWQLNSSYSTGPGEMLTDDISAEEYDYLLENIDVKDLL